MKKRLIPIIIILIMIATTACSVGETNVYFSTGNGVNYVFTMGDIKCPKSEANLYMGSFAEYYGSLGGIKIDSTDKNIKKTDEILSRSALQLMARVYSLNLYAAQRNIELSTEEESKVSEIAGSYYKNLSSDDKSKLGIDESELKKAFEKYAIAIKIHKSLMEGVDNEVTEDEARVIDGYVIHMEDPKKVNELEDRINAGDDFATLAQVYSDESKRMISFGREEFPKEVDDVAFKLEENEVSKRIDTDEGIYFVYCISKYNPEKSEYNKGAIIDKRQKVLLDQIYKEQTENNYSEINEEYFDEISPTELKINTKDSFFALIEDTLGY